MKIAIKCQHQAKLNLLTSLKEQVRTASASVLVMNGPRPETNQRIQLDDVKSAFRTRICTGIVFNLRHTMIHEFLEDAAPLVIRKIQDAVSNVNVNKVNMLLTCNYIQVGEEDPSTNAFNTRNVPIYPATDLSVWFRRFVMDLLLRDMDEFEQRGSGWTLHSIVNLAINANKHNPMRGSSYIELPDVIKKRGACINVRNEDQECFRWAILSALHPGGHHDRPDRVRKYLPYKDMLHFHGLTYPIMPKDVKKYEKQNNMSVCVFVLMLQRGEYTVLPCYVGSEEKERHVNLLPIQDYNEDQYPVFAVTQQLPDTPPKYHYVWIKHFSRLLQSQVTKHQNRVYFCYRCLHYFHFESRLKAHKVDCNQIHTAGRTRLPKGILTKGGFGDDIVQCKNYEHKEEVPFIVYADFECILVPVNSPPANTQVVQRHEPSAWATTSTAVRTPDCADMRPTAAPTLPNGSLISSWSSPDSLLAFMPTKKTCV